MLEISAVAKVGLVGMEVERGWGSPLPHPMGWFPPPPPPAGSVDDDPLTNEMGLGGRGRGASGAMAGRGSGLASRDVTRLEKAG